MSFQIIRSKKNLWEKMSTLMYNFFAITKLCLKRSHLAFECDFVNSTVKYYLPSLRGTEREES